MFLFKLLNFIELSNIISVQTFKFFLRGSESTRQCPEVVLTMSIVCTSPEIRLIIRPSGVLSKKRIGAFKMLLIILLCNRFAAVSAMNSRKAMAKRTNLILVL